MRRSMIVLLAVLLVFGFLVNYASAQVPQANSKAWMGINVRTVDRALARSHDLSVDQGALITDVVPNSPADNAGLRVGDVITRFEGTRVDEAGDIVRIADRFNPGDRAGLTVMRNGRTQQISLTFGDIQDSRSNGQYDQSNRYPSANNRTGRTNDPDQPATGDMNRNRGSYGTDQGPFIGVRLQDLTPQMADYFGVRSGTGALVAEVMANSPAERAGLHAGDVIISVDDRNVASGRDVQQFIQGRNTGSTVTLQVVRDRRPTTFSVRLTQWNGQDTWGSRPGDPDYGMNNNPTGTNDVQSLQQQVEDLRQQVEDLQQTVRDLERRIE